MCSDHENGQGEVHMSVFINPFTDFGFKRIFGQEDSKDLLINFLNALFEDEIKILDLTYHDKEQLGALPEDRSIIYDIHCTDNKGRIFIIEMQNKSHVHFEDRAIYYISSSIMQQGQKGTSWLYLLHTVIGIYFMRFEEERFRHRFRSEY